MRRGARFVLAVALGVMGPSCASEQPPAAGGDSPTTAISCVDCHRHDYDATKNPPHADGGLHTACASCHLNTHWVPANGYSHPDTFPLVGKHAAVSCDGCHATDPKPPTDCADCHIAAWKATTNPGHGTAGIGMLCGDCHTADGWHPAPFPQHEAIFPLQTSKRHRDIACAVCHDTPLSYKEFSCFNGCHSKPDTDKDHEGEVAGYVYDSTACLNCHPKGEE